MRRTGNADPGMERGTGEGQAEHAEHDDDEHESMGQGSGFLAAFSNPTLELILESFSVRVL